jgi:ubiquinol-cytochrome c reductase cytochrome c1 subunit
MDMTMRGLRRVCTALAALALCAVAGIVHASGGAELRMQPAPTERLNEESLQRGARNFVNYCLNCHSARYMRYSTLTRIGLSENQVKDNLMFTTDKIGSTMEVAMPAKQAAAWFGAPPPDLSVEARVRGRDWLYNYLIGFYRDDKAPSGWNNLVFRSVAMPHVLWQLGGINKLNETEFEDHEKATAAAIAVKGLSLVEPVAGGKYVLLTATPDTPGTLSRVEYEQWVADLVNYLEYQAEPARNQRINLGIVVLIFLGVLLFLAYWTKREYWKELH